VSHALPNRQAWAGTDAAFDVWHEQQRTASRAGAQQLAALLGPEEQAAVISLIRSAEARADSLDAVAGICVLRAAELSLPRPDVSAWEGYSQASIEELWSGGLCP